MNATLRFSRSGETRKSTRDTFFETRVDRSGFDLRGPPWVRVQPPSSEVVTFMS